MEVVKIGRRQDDPIHILIWRADELAPALVGLTVGVFLGQALLFSALGFVITKYYKQYRDNNPDGHLMHMLYYYGYFPLKAKCMRNPYIKRYFP